MLLIGKKESFENGSYFYHKLGNKTIFRIEREGQHSCWMLSDTEYEEIRSEKKKGKIPFHMFPNWVWNNCHVHSARGIRYSDGMPKSFDPVIHFDGVEWDVCGVLLFSDHGEQDAMEQYDRSMIQYHMGICKYMPIITLN